MQRRRNVLPGALVLVFAFLSACAPPSESREAQPGTGGSRQEQRRAPKVLNLAKTEGHISDFPGVTGRQPGGLDSIVHNFLVVRNDRDEFVPQLAAGQISVSSGTWRVNSDGTMDTFWKIRPNIQWHDGAPFTSADLVFTFTAFKDQELPSRFGAALKIMESATAPDPLTLAIHWSRPLATANQAPALNPMPKHLLEDAYRNDKASFANSARLSTEFIGLGPYRLVTWERGAHVEFERFDGYFFGRPPLDRVIVRFIPDPNTVIANVLSGTIDVAWGNHVDIETAVELQRRWERTGNQVRFAALDDLQQLEIQYRPEYARPRSGLTDRMVRQALYHAIDRNALVEAATHGLAPVADDWFRPGHVLRSQVEGYVPQFAYDPGRAQQLLTQAGWARGPDSVLFHTPTGERFEMQVLIQDVTSEDDQIIIAEHWKALGVHSTLARVPVPRDRQAEATQPGVIVTSPKGYEVPFLDSSRLYSGNISSAANRWTGRNRGGYINQQVDALLEKLAVTIDPIEALPLHRQLLQEMMNDVAFMPLYFDINSIVMLKGVKGPIGGTSLDWNFFEWDKE